MKAQVDRVRKEVPSHNFEVKLMIGSAAQAARERGKEMGVYEIAKAAYEGAPQEQKRFHEQVLQTVMRLEQAIGSYKTALKDVVRAVEYEQVKMENGFMPAMFSLPGHAEKAMDLQREIKDLTDRVKTLMWGLEWSEEKKDEMWEAIGATLKGEC